nr:hypothetical protein [Tanacetum cinerariifolium]
MVVVTFGDSRVTGGNDGATMWHRYGLGGDGELGWGFGGGGELRWGLSDSGSILYFSILMLCDFGLASEHLHSRGFSFGVMAGYTSTVVVWVLHRSRVHLSPGGLSGRFSDSYRLLLTCMLLFPLVLSLTMLMACYTNNMMVLLCLFSIACFQRGLARSNPSLPNVVWGFLGITNAIRSWGVLGGSMKLVRETLAESSSPMVDVDKGDHELSEQNLKQCKRKICDGHYTTTVRVLSSSGVSPYNDATLQELKAKHPFKAVVAISDELISSITHVVNLFLKGKRPMMLDGYLDGIQFGIGVSGGGEAILHAVNRLVEDRVDDVGLSMLLVDFQNAFNLVDRKLLIRACTGISKLYFAMRTCPLRVFVSAQRSFDMALRSSLERIITAFGPGLAIGNRDSPHYPLHLGGFDVYSAGDVLNYAFFASRLQYAALQTKLIRHMALWQSQMEDHTLDWLRVVPISGLGQAMNGKTYRCVLCYRLGVSLFSLSKPCSACSKVFTRDMYGDHAISCAGIIGIKHRHNDVRDTLVDICFQSGISAAKEVDIGLGGDCDKALRPAVNVTKLLRHAGIVASGSTFDDALCVFNNAMEIDFLSNPSEMALWQSQRGHHNSDWLCLVSISGLGQTIKGKTYRCVLCYRLGVPLFSVSKSCSACFKAFTRDVYGVHVVSCTGIIGIKHRHNTVRDTLVDICFQSGISACKEVDIGLSGDGDKALRPADILLYSWDRGLEVCVDLTGSSPLTQTWMTDFAPGRTVTDDAHRKRGKYMTKCAAIGYWFLPFSFSPLGELETDVVTLLKRIRKFSMAQDIEARAFIHIFNMISFSIAK